MYPPLNFPGIRRSITAIACTAAIVITAGCGDSSSPELGNMPAGEAPPAAAASPAPTAEETAADQRAQALVARMTLDEKVDMMHGESNSVYSFYNNPVVRVGLPAQQMTDGPRDVGRSMKLLSTSFPFTPFHSLR